VQGWLPPIDKAQKKVWRIKLFHIDSGEPKPTTVATVEDSGTRCQQLGRTRSWAYLCWSSLPHWWSASTLGLGHVSNRPGTHSEQH
jgi:hypothetical protein